MLQQNLDGDGPTVEEAAQWRDEFGLSYPVLADTDGITVDDYNPEKRFPFSWVIDREQRIVSSHNRSVGVEETREQLEELLAQ